MKNILLSLVTLLCFASSTTAQKHKFFKETNYRKKNISLSWGYNHSSYSKSNLTLKGDNYNFVIENMIADDAQTPFDWAVYFTPASLSIPQYNFNIGYYIDNHWSINFNVDHMKYVMRQDQTALIDGYINEPNNPYNGTYAHQPIVLTSDFLTFEHTDGLNYLNIEVSYTQDIYSSTKQNFIVEAIGGAAAGISLPKTNAKLFNYPRHDDFHVAGFGLSSRVGLNFVFYKHFFIQTNLKGGWINMPDIIIRSNSNDRAKQNFFFGEVEGLFGVMYPIKKK